MICPLPPWSVLIRLVFSVDGFLVIFFADIDVMVISFNCRRYGLKAEDVVDGVLELTL